VNLDRIDVEAGVVMARRIGYSSRNEIMLVEYCLSRWAKGEEHLAESTAIHMGIDLTSWRMILAEAMSVATQIAAIRNRN
jgi:hypothetical protein